jgi:hypothetical protein
MSPLRVVSCLLEDELKYWVSPTGEIVKCNSEHGVYASKVLKTPIQGKDYDAQLLHSSELRDQLMRKGWARVNLLPGNTMWIDTEVPLTRKQREVISDWADRIKVKTVGI